VGTSSIAAKKIVHGLRCQGLPAFFLSSEDSLHGASGAVKAGDLFIAISNGGTSTAVNQSTKIAQERGAFVIAITADEGNPLAMIADSLVIVKVQQESDYIGFLATSSILCVIALFDAVCSVIMAEKNFTKEKFSRIHPEGKVGLDITKKDEE
jgi:D-arabinose 5-phosphate isomerase GutQ